MDKTFKYFVNGEAIDKEHLIELLVIELCSTNNDLRLKKAQEEVNKELSLLEQGKPNRGTISALKAYGVSWAEPKGLVGLKKGIFELVANNGKQQGSLWQKVS